MKQRVLALALLPLLVLLLFGCAKKEYTADLPTATLMETVIPQIPVEQGYAHYDEAYRKACFPEDTLSADACLCYSILAEDVNEIGIFRTSSQKEQKQIEEACRAYLADLREEKGAFLASYAPRELPKLERAEVRSFGPYTVYAILSDSDRAQLFDAVEGMLKESVGEGG